MDPDPEPTDYLIDISWEDGRWLSMDSRATQKLVRDLRERISPGLWKLCFPRRIQAPPGYRRHEIQGILNFGSISRVKAWKQRAFENGGSENYHPPAAERAVIFSTCIGIHYQWPTYFLSPAIAEALLATDPPRDLQLRDIHWPMPFMNLVLPRDMGEQLFGVEVLTLHVTMLDPEMADTILKKYGIFKYTSLDADGLFCMHAECLEGSGINDYGMIAHGKSFVGSLDDMAMEKTSDSLPMDSVVTPHDEALNRKLHHLAISTAMLLSNPRPGMVQTGSLTRPERIRHGQVDQEALWSPNWIGRHYVSVSEGGGGTHASPRTHWRRGHFRKQAYGPAYSRHKLLWIEPVLVKADANPHDSGPM